MKTHDEQLVDMMDKYCPGQTMAQIMKYQLKVPIRVQAMFPLILIFYRKEISFRNQEYLVCLPMRSLSGYVSYSRNLKHKGWGILATYFNLKDRFEFIPNGTRMTYYKYRNWDHLSRILTDDEKLLLSDLKKEFPCPEKILKSKKGQYKMII